MPPLYTRRGDDGFTAALGGKRLAKTNLRISALGDLDELNAALGLARSILAEGAASQLILQIQESILKLSAEIALEGDVEAMSPRISQDDVGRLETEIDEREKTLEPLKAFVLPGPPQAAAALHLARAVCRRAERTVVALHLEKPVRPELLAYVNRLSDLLFILARVAA